MRLRRTRRHVGWEVSIAPLIDVVFQLIIYGLVVSLIAKVECEDIALPQARKGEEGKEALALRLVINVRKNGQIVVGGQGHTAESLQPVLAGESARAKNESGTLTVLVRGDRETDWKYIAQVMSACAAGGISRVHVAVVEPGEGEGGP
jgi:biopolymer transport protein ExbD